MALNSLKGIDVTRDSQTAHIGLPMFHVTVDDLIGVRGVVFSAGAGSPGQRHAGSRRIFERAVLPTGADGALAVMVDRFEALAGPFAGIDDETGCFDLAELVGEAGVMLTRRGVFIRLSQPGHEEIRFGSESVIVLEVLASLGNELAARAQDEELKRAWCALLERCEILPMAANDWFDGREDQTELSEARWYADRIGQDHDYYIRAAKWLRSRQFLFAMGHLPSEPTAAEYAPEAVLDLPNGEELDALVLRASEGFGQSPDDFVADAVSDRNIVVRQKVVFQRWYGASRKDSHAPSP